MDNKYPQNAPVSSTPYPTSYFKEVDLRGQVQPPAFTPQVVKSEVPVWFTISKYYLLIVNGIAFGFTALLVGLLALAGLVFLFKEPAIGVALIFVTGLVSLVPLYLWHVPIKGASKELSTRLIIHGILGVLFLSGVFVGTTQFPKARNAQEERIFALLQTTNSPSVRLSRFVYGAIEVAACFGMAHIIRKREMNNHFGMA